MKRISLALLLASLVASAPAQAVNGLCMIASSHNSKHNTDNLDVMLRSSDCATDDDGDHCSNSEHSGMDWSRWTGVSPQQLSQEGASLTAQMTGDAGELRCSGTVHDGVLAGRYKFTPDSAYFSKMAAMGFTDISPRKFLGFLILNITIAWTQQMKDAGVTDLSTNKLMGLRALHVDLDYIHAMAAAGYPELRANKLTSMKAVGVTPEKAKEARDLGFQPTESQLEQMCIFKVDRAFVERMRAHGVKDLSLEKLIQVKIFKLDD
ncbi:MAG: hypothetical protein V4555_07025 [Acidobacteriota bacterium]